MFGPVFQRDGLCKFLSVVEPRALREKTWPNELSCSLGFPTLKKGNDEFDAIEIETFFLQHLDRLLR